MLGEYEIEDTESSGLLTTILEQFVVNSAVDALLVKKAETLLSPYHREPSENLISSGCVVNDLPQLKNAFHHLIVYTRCVVSVNVNA